MPKLPENTSYVIPRLICRDPAAEVEFCRNVFGAIALNERPGPGGTLVHALLSLQSQMLMIEGVWPTLPSRAPLRDGTSPVVIFIYVEDVDRTLKCATDHGANVLVPVQDQFWG